jgi:hypothetical protein
MLIVANYLARGTAFRSPQIAFKNMAAPKVASCRQRLLMASLAKCRPKWRIKTRCDGLHLHGILPI